MPCLHFKKYFIRHFHHLYQFQGLVLLRSKAVSLSSRARQPLNPVTSQCLMSQLTSTHCNCKKIPQRRFPIIRTSWNRAITCYSLALHNKYCYIDTYFYFVMFYWMFVELISNTASVRRIKYVFLWIFLKRDIKSLKLSDNLEGQWIAFYLGLTALSNAWHYTEFLKWNKFIRL